jgi:hypothetical protein
MEGRGEEGQGRKRGKGREEGGEGMIRNDRPSPHQKILDPPLTTSANSRLVPEFILIAFTVAPPHTSILTIV